MVSNANKRTDLKRIKIEIGVFFFSSPCIYYLSTFSIFHSSAYLRHSHTRTVFICLICSITALCWLHSHLHWSNFSLVWVNENFICTKWQKSDDNERKWWPMLLCKHKILCVEQDKHFTLYMYSPVDFCMWHIRIFERVFKTL